MALDVGENKANKLASVYQLTPLWFLNFYRLMLERRTDIESLTDKLDIRDLWDIYLEVCPGNDILQSLERLEETELNIESRALMENNAILFDSIKDILINRNLQAKQDKSIWISILIGIEKLENYISPGSIYQNLFESFNKFMGPLSIFPLWFALYHTPRTQINFRHKQIMEIINNMPKISHVSCRQMKNGIINQLNSELQDHEEKYTYILQLSCLFGMLLYMLKLTIPQSETIPEELKKSLPYVSHFLTSLSHFLSTNMTSASEYISLRLTVDLLTRKLNSYAPKVQSIEPQSYSDNPYGFYHNRSKQLTPTSASNNVGLNNSPSR